MARSTASRKYQLTINNPLEHGFTHDTIKNILNAHSSIEYWCLCDEIGAEGTPHTHIYAVFTNAVMFTTLQKRFYGAHIETARGSNQENRDYIRKEGKWLEDEKRGTNLIDTFEESGDLPPDRASGIKQTEAIYQMVKDGANDVEIMETYPNAMNRLDKIERARQRLLFEKFKTIFRQLHVTYIWGDTGVGKTRSIMEKYGYKNVFRVTDYVHPFEGYEGEDVIIFDEFRSGVPISEMLNYLDGYPLQLPSRYNKKQACYTKVFIISNIPLEQQYPNIQISEPKTWQAFLRRIHEIFRKMPYDSNPLNATPDWLQDVIDEGEMLC
jgi:hypothetical protein